MSVQGDEIIKRMLLSENRCIVRTYIISAFNLAQRDNDSPSDPYVVLRLGDKVFNDRENYILDEPNPKICKKIDFEAVFPGCPQLKIAFWDYDLLFGDDLIGETVIDLEDRYFSALERVCPKANRVAKVVPSELQDGPRYCQAVGGNLADLVSSWNS